MPGTVSITTPAGDTSDDRVLTFLEQTRTSHRAEYGAAASRNSVDGGGQQPKSFGPSLNGSTGWMGSNIWGGNGSLSSGLGANTLDRSTSRSEYPPSLGTAGLERRQHSSSADNASLLGNGADAPEGKTGSRSLLSTSETDGGWARRSPWGADTQASGATRRSSGVSPSRQRSGPTRSPNNQPLLDISQSPSHRMSNSRSGMVGQDTFRSHSLQLDAMSNDYPQDFDRDLNGSNSVERLLNQHAQRSNSMFNGWTDSAPVHSP
ncbi:MAG: hypothetical protein INR71_15810, partial [Terriglobus roseus]|nr:hypothetical protein [Terriglobus roseus]